MNAQDQVDAQESDGISIRVSLLVNGKTHTIHVDPRMTLLDCLREVLHLTGTKKGCDHGQCGACTVHIDGRRTNSCLALAAVAGWSRDYDHRRPGLARASAPDAGSIPGE